MHHSAAGVDAKWVPIESKPARHVQRVIEEHRMVKATAQAAALQVGWLAFWVFLGVLVPPARCLASDMRVVAVTPGQSAEVVIGDGAPVTIQVGETIEGVKLLSADRDGAVLSADGITETLPLVADRSIEHAAGSSTVTLSADARGQFVTSGAVNGRPVNFLVDTGATLTTLSRAEATRIGLDYSGGRPATAQTPNGVVHGWRVSLGSVRVGNVTVRDVDAIVLDNDTLPVGLLGMSFLGRFDMQRLGSTLVLRRSR
jgi:aspartyl protease family protein